MSDLFSATRDAAAAPLPYRLLPQTLDHFFGQEHLLGAGKLLRRLIETDRVRSCIFHGPPGTGKSALANIIAQRTASRFIRLNATTAGVKDLKAEIDAAREQLDCHRRRTLLFVDEIHRFNKLQQDALLPSVEEGVVALIGATTENPYYALNSALLSRSNLFQFKSLDDAALARVLDRALADSERGVGAFHVTLAAAARAWLLQKAAGDARQLLMALEVAALSTAPDAAGRRLIDEGVARESIQQAALRYDRGDQHYDTISAFIKSMRGSNPDAALYWLAVMLEGGDDPLFIARRMVIFASEDIGLADPQALGVAVAAQQAVDFVGLPEGRIPLAFAAVYLARAPKDNRAYAGIDAALEYVRGRQQLEVPDHLKDKTYQAKAVKGAEYKYPHDYAGAKVAQEYLPPGAPRFFAPDKK